ncbi:hypothetical protein HPB49_008209 [Dermacentor silvarum]|uniref:Uncharacterized protein n=1 Tax=Dermacentor silvarum TaxID=543639 RepID=A0ACB8DIM4_DERSI|nr:hypothetical protein HPB49_008209 [Dermacentor silvarum]
MSREVLSKCKTLRPNVTPITSEIDKKVAEDADKAQITMLLNQMMSVSQTLNQVNAQIELLIEPEEAETEFERVLHYEWKIVAATTKLEERIREFERATQQSTGIVTGQVSTAQSTNHVSEMQELVKLRRLEMIKFDGKRTAGPRFRHQFETSVRNRLDMPRSEEFNYLLASLNGQAASLVEGLQLPDKYYEHAVTLLKETLVRQDYLREIHLKKTRKRESSEESQRCRRLEETFLKVARKHKSVAVFKGGNGQLL